MDGLWVFVRRHCGGVQTPGKKEKKSGYIMLARGSHITGPGGKGRGTPGSEALKPFQHLPWQCFRALVIHLSQLYVIL